MLEKTLSKDNPFKGNEKIQLLFLYFYITIECIQSFFFRNARIVNASNVGQSLSAQPLLPIGDTSLGKNSVYIVLHCLHMGLC